MTGNPTDKRDGGLSGIGEGHICTIECIADSKVLVSKSAATPKGVSPH